MTKSAFDSQSLVSMLIYSLIFSEVIIRFYRMLPKSMKNILKPVTQSFANSYHKWLLSSKSRSLRLKPPKINLMQNLIFSRSSVRLYSMLPQPVKKILNPLKQNLIHIYHQQVLRKK